jgi:hypothetical protein
MPGKYKKFKKPIFLPNASRMGYDKYEVVIGDFIGWQYTYHEDAESFHGTNRSDLFYGRVLGEAMHDGVGKKYPSKPRVLAVLQLGYQFNHGWVNHVPVDAVKFCHDTGAFTRWALFGEMLSPELTERLAAYGALSNGHIDKLLDESGMKIVKMPWENRRVRAGEGKEPDTAGSE